MDKIYVLFKNDRPVKAYISARHVTLKLKNNRGESYEVAEYALDGIPRNYTEQEWYDREKVLARPNR